MANTAMEELMKGLTESLQKALTPDEPKGDDKQEDAEKDTQKAMDARFAKMEESLAALATGVQAITKMLSPGDDKGEGRGEITKAISDIAETVGAHHQTLERMLDRSAVKKSIDGDDFEEDSKDGKSEPLLKADGSKSLVLKQGAFDSAIRAVLNGHKIELH